jgi:tRNA modification GTPase
VGRPNVGKSSLLNALLRGDRAIVTAIPGTTRDTLEETANIAGIPLVLVDTAGIRTETADEVERIGVERSRLALERADLALMVIDGSQALEQGDWAIGRLVGNKAALLVINKNDLAPAQNQDQLADFLPAAQRVHISALANEGIEALEEGIVELVTAQAAIAAQQADLSPDLVSIDVRAAVDALGEITGETVTEDLLDTIFSKFCIGK